MTNQRKGTSSLTAMQRPGHQADNGKMVYSAPSSHRYFTVLTNRPYKVSVSDNSFLNTSFSSQVKVLFTC